MTNYFNGSILKENFEEDLEDFEDNKDQDDEESED